MPVPVGVQLEIWEAKRDVWNSMQEYGDDVKIQFRGEGDIVRDKYNSIKQIDSIIDFTIKCFPIITNPTINQMEKAGIYERVDCLMYIAQKDFDDASLTIDNIGELRDTVLWSGQSWNIKEKNNTSQIGDAFIYIVLGLVKK